MKPEEVIKYLEMVRPAENYSHTYSVSVGNIRHFGPGSQLNKDVSTAIDLAIESLEKQIPKKPIGRVSQLGYRLECPMCATIMAYHSIVAQYCWVCGQRIDGGVGE